MWQYNYSDDYLAHYGVPGMKWGVRRYQSKDGTLTSAGKKRYSKSNDVSRMSTEELRQKVNRMNNEQRYIELNKSSTSRISKTADGIERASKMGNDVNKVYRSVKGDNNPYSKVAGQGLDALSRASRVAKKIDKAARDKKASENATKKLETMSDKDLAREVERLDLERQYSRLKDSSIRKGKIYVTDILDIAGDVVGIGASAVAIAVGIQKLINN